MRLALILLLLPLAALAGGYRWTDENGKVHFSDKPPPDAEAAEEIEIQGPKPIGQGESVHRTRRELDKLQEEREKRERDRTLRKRREEQRRLARCQRQARVLSKMKNNRVRYRQEDGSYRGVDEDTHRARIREVEQWLENHCNR